MRSITAWAALLTLAASLTSAQDSRGQGELVRPYAIAEYFAPGLIDNPGELTVFPLQGKVASIRLPIRLWGFTYSVDGKALYGIGGIGQTSKKTHLYRVDLKPVQDVQLAGSEDLRYAGGLAISPKADQLLISEIRPVGDHNECSLFRLRIPEGTVEKILDGPPSCNNRSLWNNISFSPDGLRAVAVRDHSLELIDLLTYTTKSIGQGFMTAGWSPNGKWIAAAESTGKRRTVLFETVHFTRQRTLTTSWSKWSPDSQYLITNSEHPGCDADHGTYELLDIRTGARIPVPSSKCQVHQAGSSGWISTDILP
jgi:hypothetical protein